MIIPIDKWTLILKIGAKWSFSYETKASTQLSQREEWNYGAQSLKEWKLLCESMFISVERWALIQKLLKGEVFFSETKASICLSQKEECISGAQSWKEKRLLRESVFTTFDRRALILKNGGKWSFSY